MNTSDDLSLNYYFSINDSFAAKLITWKGGGFTNAIMKDVQKCTPKVRISKLTGAPIRERNHTNALGKVVRGASLVLMNLQDITENIPVQSHSNAHTVTDAFQGQITCHCTWSATELVSVWLLTDWILNSWSWAVGQPGIARSQDQSSRS